ncbi:MAG TPA: alpha/beta hydrolase-fold protein [Polyangiaceae bacterium]|nr:alpha/beta hydrolase-fold protein [Polyangiaceae bacterium]
MSFKPTTLTTAFMAVFLSAACSDGANNDTNGSEGGTTSSAGTGGGSSLAGTTSSTAGSGAPAGGGGVVGVSGGGAGGSDAPGAAGTLTGGSSFGGNAGTAGAGGGQTGGNAQGGATGMPPKVTPSNATSIPSEYGGAVANGGKWTSKTYPVYFYTTESSGSASMMGSIPRQGTPITKPVNIYTPPDYDAKSEYPLLFVFHGITDNQNTWAERANPKIATLFDNLITKKVIKPLVVVFPQGDSKPNFASNTSYSDTAGYYRFGNELMGDLVPFIEANYSVKKDRGSRGIAGFSMGGMQTINVGLCQNLKNFAWFGALHPAGGNFGSSDIAKYVELQDAKTYPLYYFYIGVGNNDSTASASAAASAKDLTTKGPYITTANFSMQNNLPGGHVYPTAEVGLYNFVRMAFAN